MEAMLHSELTRRLQGLANLKVMPIGEAAQNLIRDTSGGVAPEGAEFGARWVKWGAGESADAKLGASSGANGRLESASIAPRDLSISHAASAAANGTLRSKYALGLASKKELEGVNVDLVRCVNVAITLTTQDFCVYDGLRTYKEQQAILAAGKSRTMNSKHLVGLAADLVPWIGGQPKWDWHGCYKIAYAMDLAATQLGIAHKITWGGAWDRTLADFGSDLGSYEQEVRKYRERHGGPDFIDGPHFQIQP
jgi:peptidoglycan LD-endopeptidase CwlK